MQQQKMYLTMKVNINQDNFFKWKVKESFSDY